MALRIAICPTGPQPHTTTVSRRFDVALHGCLPASREDVAEEEQLLVRNALWHLDVRLVGKGHAKVFGLSARIATGQVRVAEETRRGVAEHLVGKVLLAVRRLADREVAATALAALAAKDREGHDDAVALAEVAVHRRSPPRRLRPSSRVP